jgi:hypothetical protein
MITTWGSTQVLVLPPLGEPITIDDLLDLVGSAYEADVRVVAVPVARLPETFFDLRTGVAGEMVQKLVNYRLRLAVVGELPASARASRSFTSWVREGEQGRQAWFLPSLDALRSSLGDAAASPRADRVIIEPDRS